MALFGKPDAGADGSVPPYEVVGIYLTRAFVGPGVIGGGRRARHKHEAVHLLFDPERLAHPIGRDTRTAAPLHM